MATPAAALAGSAVGEAIGSAFAPIVIEFGGDGARIPFTDGTRRKRNKVIYDNRMLIKRLEIPAAVYIPVLVPVMLIGTRLVTGEPGAAGSGGPTGATEAGTPEDAFAAIVASLIETMSGGLIDVSRPASG